MASFGGWLFVSTWLALMISRHGRIWTLLAQYVGAMALAHSFALPLLGITDVTGILATSITASLAFLGSAVVGEVFRIAKKGK